MTAAAWERWLDGAIRGYAADKVRVGAWRPDEAQERSARAFAQLLPEGRATKDQQLRSIVNASGEVVGVLWFGPWPEVGAAASFIWDLEIEEAHRGRGYGRAAMEALEPLARSLGYRTIGLHVFGDNDVARNLYRSAGYRETDVAMRKELD